MNIHSWKDVPAERINENIKRKMIWGENVMVVRWELAPKTELPEHEHVAEQVVMVHEGSVTLSFPSGESKTLGPGDMLVVPPSLPHGVVVGDEGCIVTDLFSPIREDFLEGRDAYLGKDEEQSEQGEADSQEEAYKKLYVFLKAAGIKATLEQAKQVPLELLSRYAYEKQCLNMGQLREILGMDKQQAKSLLREWKHGDDHSQSSYEKMLRTMVILPWEQG